MAALPTLDTPLPILTLDPEQTSGWQWPLPPFARSQAMAPLEDVTTPCRIETPNGAAVDGQLVHFDVDAEVLRFELANGATPLALPFSKFRRLSLGRPWSLARRAPGAPQERVTTAAQERSYCIELALGGNLSGRTLGHVEEECGYFFFSPLDDGAAVQRIFVPRAACLSLSLGKSAEEQAAERWVGTREQLLAALEAQPRVKIKPLGEALVDLGFITRGVLERAIADQHPERSVPLGEDLVGRGLLSRADLRTALAHKMGYPLVDLTRFPVDPEAVCKLSQRVMLEHNVLPLLQDGERLIVAVDDLVRVPRLQSLRGLTEVKVVPVLASRSRISLALAALGTDRWADHVPMHLKLLVTAPGTFSRR